MNIIDILTEQIKKVVETLYSSKVDDKQIQVQKTRK